MASASREPLHPAARELPPREGGLASYLPVERSCYPRGWDVQRLEVCACPWRFGSMEEMLRFCKLLFGLRADCDDTLAEALSNIVGIEHTAAGLELQWELLYLDVCCD